MKSSQKALRYVTDKKVFKLKNGGNTEFWGVEGKTGVWTVRYDKLKDRYSCDCPNIRTTPCAHQKSVILFKQNDQKNKTSS